MLPAPICPLDGQDRLEQNSSRGFMAGLAGWISQSNLRSCRTHFSQSAFNHTLVGCYRNLQFASLFGGAVVRRDHLGQYVRLSGIPLQVRVALPAVILYAEGLVELSILRK